MRTIHPQTIPSGKLTVCKLENHHLQKVNQLETVHFQWTCEITRGYNHPDYQILSNYHKLSNTTWMNIILQILTNYQIINQLSTNCQIINQLSNIIKPSSQEQIISNHHPCHEQSMTCHDPVPGPQGPRTSSGRTCHCLVVVCAKVPSRWVVDGGSCLMMLLMLMGDYRLSSMLMHIKWL